jgi:hypothetical protein
MRRLYLLLTISVCCAVAGRAGAQQIGISETHDGGVFGVHVGEIVSWLALKQDVQMSGDLAHWDNNVSGAGGAGESVAVLRLVLNRDVRVLGVATPLRHPSITRSSLATFLSVATDGDGSDDRLEDGTGDPASGFLQAERAAERGVGEGNFVYVGGGTISAGEGDANPWATPQRMGELSAARGGNGAATATYALGTFLEGGAIIRHVARDGAVVITVRVQAATARTSARTLTIRRPRTLRPRRHTPRQCNSPRFLSVFAVGTVQ